MADNREFITSQYSDLPEIEKQNFYQMLIDIWSECPNWANTDFDAYFRSKGWRPTLYMQYKALDFMKTQSTLNSGIRDAVRESITGVKDTIDLVSQTKKILLKKAPNQLTMLQNDVVSQAQTSIINSIANKIGDLVLDLQRDVVICNKGNAYAQSLVRVIDLAELEQPVYWVD